MSFWSSQLNTKTVKTLSADDLNTVFNNVHIEDANVESLIQLEQIKRVAGFTPGTPWKGTPAIKAITLLGEGSDNKQTIHRPAQGEVWELIQSSIEVSVIDAGSQSFRILTYDDTNYVCHIEYSSGVLSIVQEPILNEITSTGTREGGFNNRIFYDYNNYLVCYGDASSSFTTDPVINSFVCRVN